MDPVAQTVSHSLWERVISGRIGDQVVVRITRDSALGVGTDGTLSGRRLEPEPRMPVRDRHALRREWADALGFFYRETATSSQD